MTLTLLKERMPGRGLALLALLLIAIASCVTFLARFAKENVEVSSKVNDLPGRLVLEDDITFKYFDIIEKDLLRDTSNFESRSKLMKDVCDKYRDPFRCVHCTEDISNLQKLYFPGLKIVVCTSHGQHCPTSPSSRWPERRTPCATR